MVIIKRLRTTGGPNKKKFNCCFVDCGRSFSCVIIICFVLFIVDSYSGALENGSGLLLLGGVNNKYCCEYLFFGGVGGGMMKRSWSTFDQLSTW